MLWTIVLAALLIIAVVFLIKGPKVTDSSGDVYNLRIIGWIALALFLVVTGFTTITQVQAKQQGVLVTGGKPADRTLDPGYNLKLPWQKVVTVDTTRQTDNYNGGSEDTDHGDISVRLGNGNVSTVKASITWKVNDDLANTVYGEFRADDPTEQVYKNLVAPNFKQAINSVLGQYNPTQEILDLSSAEDASATSETTDVAVVNLAPDFDQFADDVRDSFLRRINPNGELEDSEALIQVLAVQVSYLAFDDDTQKKINEYQDEVQKTIIAAQSVKTAEQQALANGKIAASIAKDPNILASRCFDMIAEGKLVPPINFSCYPGSSGSAVVLPSAPTTQ